MERWLVRGSEKGPKRTQEGLRDYSEELQRVLFGPKRTHEGLRDYSGSFSDPGRSEDPFRTHEGLRDYSGSFRTQALAGDLISHHLSDLSTLPGGYTESKIEVLARQGGEKFSGVKIHI